MHFPYYFVAGLPWLRGQEGFQEGERFVLANISKDAHVYLRESTSRCRANIEYMEPIVDSDAPIMYYINTEVTYSSFRIKSSLGFFFKPRITSLINKYHYRGTVSWSVWYLPKGLEIIFWPTSFGQNRKNVFLKIWTSHFGTKAASSASW